MDCKEWRKVVEKKLMNHTSKKKIIEKIIKYFFNFKKISKEGNHNL